MAIEYRRKPSVKYHCKQVIAETDVPEFVGTVDTEVYVVPSCRHVNFLLSPIYLMALLHHSRLQLHWTRQSA